MTPKQKNATGASAIAVILITVFSYVGMTEKPNNSGFNSESFQQAMQEVGWRKGDAWCVYFCKLVWHQAIADPHIDSLAMTLITGNSQTTLWYFTKDKSGYFKVSDTASVGSIVIWQHYKDGVPKWKGHAGIVTVVHKNYFETVEGNTNDVGGSEGYIVAMKAREYNFKNMNGLRLRKFISLKNY